MSHLNDVVPLFQQSENDDLQYHQGTVTVWDTTGNTNEVNINGTLISDIAFIDDTDIVVGSLVAILRYQTTYIILGKIKVI